MKKLVRFAVFPLLTLTLILASGCGRSEPKKDKRTFAQQSADLPDSGYYLCRHDFNFAYNDRGETTGEFIAIAENGRKSRKKAILQQCVSNESRAYQKACADPAALKGIECIHDTLLAPIFTPDTTRKTQCSLTYSSYFNGEKLKDLGGEITSNLVSADLLAHTHSIVDQCLKLTGAEKDGCTRALAKGEMTCKSI